MSNLKFSPYTLTMKRRLKQLRLGAGLRIKPAADELGITRKQLEDVETTRSYGCHLDLELLAQYCKTFNVPFGELMHDPRGTVPEYLERPRKRLGSATRTRE